MAINIKENVDIVKSPEGCFKKNVIGGYELSIVEDSDNRRSGLRDKAT